jgi:hypothetical protein
MRIVFFYYVQSAGVGFCWGSLGFVGACLGLCSYRRNMFEHSRMKIILYRHTDVNLRKRGRRRFFQILKSERTGNHSSSSIYRTVQ